MTKKNLATKEKVLQIATKQFAEKGFDGTTIRDITTLADTNVSSINYHFGSKEDLFSEIVKKFSENFRRFGSLLRPAKSFDEFKILLEMFFRQMLELATNEIDSVELFFNEHGLIMRKYFHLIEGNFMAFRTGFLQFLTDAQNAGIISPDRDIEIFQKMFMFHLKGEITECKVGKKMQLPTVLDQEYKELYIKESLEMFYLILENKKENS